MPRLFLGSFLTTQEQAAFAQLQDFNSGLSSEWHCQIRWINSEKLHMTWLFLGELEDEDSLRLKESIAPLLHDVRTRDPLTLSFNQLEAWAVRGAPRHIVLTPEQCHRQFLDLAERLRKGLGPFVAGDSKGQASKPLRPHVTLMRLSPEGEAQATLPTFSATDNTHPLRHHDKMDWEQLDYSQIKGLSELLPLKQSLNVVSLIESYNHMNSHQYRILQDFPLTENQND